MGIQWEYLLFSLESSKKPSAGIPDPFGESHSHFLGQVGCPQSISPLHRSCTRQPSASLYIVQFTCCEQINQSYKSEYSQRSFCFASLFKRQSYSSHTELFSSSCLPLRTGFPEIAIIQLCLMKNVRFQDYIPHSAERF